MKATIDNDEDIHWCDQGWFSGVFHYGFCPNERAWEYAKTYLNHKEPYPTSAGRSTFADREGKIAVVVTVANGIEDNHTANEIASLIGHEAIHVWQELCEAIGEENPSSEFEAYSVQAIMQNLIDKFEKTRRELKYCGPTE